MTEPVSNPNEPVQKEPVQPTQNEPGTPEPTIQQPDPNSLFADQLASITTDDGRQKYGDVSTALNSIPHAQNHIKELTDKVTQLQEELTKRQGAEEMLAALQQSQQSDPAQPADPLDATAIQDLVSQTLDQRAQQELAAINGNKVKTALHEKFGDSASKEFENKAAALGLSVGQLTSLSKQSPQVVLELFGDVPVRDVQPTQPSSNAVPPNTPQDPTPDYLAKFSGTDSSLSEKWKKAKDAVQQQ